MHMASPAFSPEEITWASLRYVHDLNLVRTTCYLARTGLALVSHDFKQWLASLDNKERRKLEMLYDRQPGRIDAFEEDVKAAQPEDINVFELLQVAIVMETFLSWLLTLAVRAQDVPEQDIESEVSKHQRLTFGRQLVVIDRVAHFSLLSSFPKYKELRATRNAVVHCRRRISQQYVKEAGSLARGSLGELLVVDDAYLAECQYRCAHLFVETANELVARQNGKCSHSIPVYRGSHSVENLQ